MIFFLCCLWGWKGGGKDEVEVEEDEAKVVISILYV